jgi:hypothetical protein
MVTRIAAQEKTLYHLVVVTTLHDKHLNHMSEKVIKIGNTLADMMYLKWTNVIKVTSSFKEIWHQQSSFSNDWCTFTMPITFLQVLSTTFPIFLSTTTPMRLQPVQTKTI